MIGNILGGVGAIIGAGAQVAQVAQNKRIADQNLGFQRENLDWQRTAQRTTWDREDNAVQRRADDLEAAGLSKTLAAGSAASASGPIRTTAPQKENPRSGEGIANAVNQALAALQGQANIARTHAQQKLDDAQAQRIKTETSMMRERHDADMALTRARTAGQTQQNAYNVMNLPLQISRTRQEIRNLGYAEVNSRLQAERNELGVTRDEVALATERIRETREGRGLTKQELEIQALATANQAARWNLEQARRMFLPVGQSWSRELQMANALAGSASSPGASAAFGLVNDIWRNFMDRRPSYGDRATARGMAPANYGRPGAY